MSLENLASVISKSAPILGTAIGGPIGGAAGLIISGIANLFGGNANEPDGLAKLIQSDPDAALKLRQFEIQHQEYLYKAAIENVQSARQRESDIIKNTGKRDWLMDFLSMFIVISFLILTLVVAFVKLPPMTHDIFYMLLGAFAGGWSVILNYYFGASIANKNINYPPPQNVILPPPAHTGKG